MYTQCPECGTAFRVTAQVLKQAAGMVRCGGCANAFNALEFLSETMPDNATRRKTEPELPELTPDKSAENEQKSISAAQSAALLKTLDELAGSDIRIEDTGVEWRVFDDEDADEESVKSVDEVLEEAPTAVDEFLTSTPEVVEAPEIFSDEANGPARTPVEELRFDDNTPLPEGFGFEDDGAVSHAAFEPEPESPPEVEADPSLFESQSNIALSDPHEWTDILDEFEDLAAEAAAAAPLEIDIEEVADDADATADPMMLGEPEDLEETLALDLDGEVEDVEENEPEDVGEVDEVLALDDEEFQLDEGDEPDDDAHFEGADVVESSNGEDNLIDELPMDLLARRRAPGGRSIEDELEKFDTRNYSLDDDDALPRSAEDHFVPPPTEEEQTINMQIDQDLFALAIEDADGFATTIVIPDSSAKSFASGDDDDARDESDDDELVTDEDELSLKFGAGNVMETIIMEGEFVRSELDREKLAADAAAAAKLQAAAKAADAEARKDDGKRRYGLVAGIIGLALLLLFQLMHQSREALATIPAFNNTVGPIYRALGSPLQPAWDITGWRFEATRGSAVPTEGNSEGGEELTVFTRIGNNSDTALPFPLIRISLTDRFEEPIGSHVLEPADYLGTDVDPRKPVEPGNTFDAVVNVASPSPDATSFRLDVCYRQGEGLLRCKDDNFR